MANKKIPGNVIIYVRDGCEVCEVIEENKSEIKENLKKFFTKVFIVNVNFNPVEFSAYGFQAVPTVVFPGYRCFEGIDPSVLLEESMIERIIEGYLLPNDVLNFKARERSSQGMVENPNLDRIVGR